MSPQALSHLHSRSQVAIPSVRVSVFRHLSYENRSKILKYIRQVAIPSVRVSVFRLPFWIEEWDVAEYLVAIPSVRVSVFRREGWSCSVRREPAPVAIPSVRVSVFRRGVEYATKMARPKQGPSRNPLSSGLGVSTR